MAALKPAPGRRPGRAERQAGYLLRVEQVGNWRRYLLQDLRSGEMHRFRLAAQLQRWLRAAGRGGLR